MTKKVRIIGFAILAAIFWLTGSSVSGSPIDFDHQNHQTVEQAQYIGLVSNRLFCHNSLAQNSAHSYHQKTDSNLKGWQDQDWSTTDMIERFFESEFSQYCDFALVFLIQLPTPDIVFPFHYFW